MLISFWYIFYQFEYMYLNIFTLTGSLCINSYFAFVWFLFILFTDYKNIILIIISKKTQTDTLESEIPHNLIIIVNSLV